jgi:hypothetical protein
MPLLLKYETRGQVLGPTSFFKMLTGRTSLQVYIKIVGCDVALGQRLIAKFRGLFLRKFLSINRSDMWMAILFPHNNGIVVDLL